ncbi:major head protein [Streptomyces phage Endor2]|uniref:Major capsid protein n=1 Tax=Streptomyces phage Endor2 TaxID=2740182 RepID=A0A7G4AX15_9CAUD|nr:major head protein [Streptomyces phage Endor2]QMP84555.1 major capsid protein [Streptomyces phage Endor2]
MAEHQIVKPEKLAATAVGMLEQELVIPNLFQKEGIDQFKGADNDTVSVKVEGVLPFHDYAFRNDRSAPIVFDEYKERKIAVTFGGNVYSAVKVTDEQNDFDLDDWGKLLRPQVKAVGRGLQRRAVATLTGQNYSVVIGNAQANLRGAIIEARRVLNKFNVPDDQRYLLVGTDFESALLSDDKLNLAQNVGDSEAESALQTATLTNRFGFKIVVDQTIPADAAYAFAGSAFIFLSGAPSVPQSVPYGATQSFESIALRWVRDYDPTYMQDRSVVNTYAGFRSVTDVLVGWDSVNEKEIVSTGEHFVRGIKLTLDGSSNYPAASSELATITGISDAKVWTPTGMKAETDPANA